MSPLPDNLEPLLAGYIDGTLSKDELAQVEAYLDQQPELREELQRMMLDSEYLRMLPQARLPQDISDSVGSQMEREMLLSDAGAPTRAAQQRFGLPGLAVAAMVLMGIGVGVVTLQILGQERRPLPSVAARPAATSTPETAGATTAPVEVALTETAVMGAPPPPAPAVTVPTSAASFAALPATIEEEVVTRIDLAEVTARPIVMVVESADLTRSDLQVRSFFSDNGYAYRASDGAVFPPGGLARHIRPHGGALDASSAAPGAAVSNTAAPNAIGNAIEIGRRNREPTVLLAHGVDVSAVKQLHSQINEANIDSAFRLDRDGIADRAREQDARQQRASLYQLSAGELKMKQLASAPQGFGQQAVPGMDASPQANVAQAGQAAPGEADPDRLVQPGDSLTITLAGDAQMQTKLSAAIEVTVDSDGFITLPERGVYQVRGLTVQQVAAALAGTDQRAGFAAFGVAFKDSQAAGATVAAKTAQPKDDAPATAPATAPAVGKPADDLAPPTERVDLIVVVKPLPAESAGGEPPATMPAR